MFPQSIRYLFLAVRRKLQNGVKALGLAAGLFAGLSAPAAGAELNVAELTEMERLLARLNFDPGQIDGVVDEWTRTAVRLYQKFAALPADGVPSAALLAELRQIAQALVDLKAAQAEAAIVPPAAAEAPTLAEIAAPLGRAPEAAAETGAGPGARTAKAVTPAEPAPESAPQPPSTTDSAAAEQPARAESGQTRAGQPAPEEAKVGPARAAQAAGAATGEARAAAQAPTKAGTPPPKAERDFDLEGVIARLVRRNGRSAERPANGRRAVDSPQGGAGIARSGSPAGSKFPATASVDRDGYDEFKKGYAAAQVGNVDLAIKLYTLAIETGDLALEHLADAFYNRANAHQVKGALDYAIADYNAAILNKPDSPGAYYNRGFAFEAKGKRESAVADFKKARDLGLQRLGVRSANIPLPRR